VVTPVGTKYIGRCSRKDQSGRLRTGRGRRQILGIGGIQGAFEPLLGWVDDAYEDIECRKPGTAIAIDNKRKDRLMKSRTIQR
jgi:hypothetical protein